MESKKIKFTYTEENGKEHDIVLEFTRQTVQQLEGAGLRLSEIGDMPATQTDLLFHGAFLANHRNIKGKTVDEIWKHIPKKEDFINKLAEMFIETRDTLFEEPDEDADAAGGGADDFDPNDLPF